MLIIGHKDVSELIDMKAVKQAVEHAFVLHAKKQVEMPSKVYLSIPEYAGDFRAMPARAGDAVGLKWINSHVKNPLLFDLPTVNGVVILSDPRTGMPLAFLDGTVITKYRTAAASAVAIEWLARKDARTIGIVGCGVQAFAHVELLHSVLGMTDFRVFDIDPVKPANLITTFSDLNISSVSLEEAVQSDVVCTLTPGKASLISHEMILPGTHLNAMGADAVGKREFKPGAFQGARIFVDDLNQASHSGEIHGAIADGSLSPDDLCGTIGEVVTGLKKGRLGNEVTVFDSTGLAIQDILVAKWIYDLAIVSGKGLQYEVV